MDLAGQTVSQPPAYGATVATTSADREQAPHWNVSSDVKHIPKRPSALQTSITANSAPAQKQDSPRAPMSPTSQTPGSSSSPQSPRSYNALGLESPRSPRERLEDFLREEDPRINGAVPSNVDSKNSRLPSPPLKAQSYSQLRNISSPLPDAMSLGHSSPPSPRSTASPPLIGSPLRPGQAPRTSSIDSAISNVSLNTSHSQKGSLDSNSSDVSGLIKAAGSAENLIFHLLREKQHLEGRTAQLWSLVEKQRHLLHGLTEDLHKVAKDKERYRNELEEHKRQAESARLPTPVSNDAVPEDRLPSPTMSESSAGLPIQSQARDDQDAITVREGVLTPRPLEPSRVSDAAPLLSKDVGVTAVTDSSVAHRNANHPSKHAHKHTSSSDLGVFNVSKPLHDVPPIKTNDLSQPVSPSGTSASPRSGMSPTTSFSAKRAQTYSSKPFTGPSLTLTESTPTGNDTERMTPPRKAPPAPLHLEKPAKEPSKSSSNEVDEASGSEYGDDVEIDELPVFDRGRKKTREEDDVEREVLQKKQEEERSRSLKQKSKSRSESKKSKNRDRNLPSKAQAVALSPGLKAIAPEPTPALASSFLSQPASLAGMLEVNPSQKGVEINDSTGPVKAPLSPGLPLSPRPGDRPVNAPTPRLPRETNGSGGSMASPPLSPRPGFVGLPVSPRAPKQTALFAPGTPMSSIPTSPRPSQTERIDDQTQPIVSQARTEAPTEKLSLDSESSKSAANSSIAPRSKGIFKGFMTEAYPGLLLPPNALPSIKVTVVSSRLLPSRQSVMFKGSDDEPVFTLGISARFDEQDLWNVEKPILSLQNLDLQLRQSSRIDAKLPERALFSGHAPAKVDARRIALERYFEVILDTQLDESAAVAICQYLSTQATEPTSRRAPNSVNHASPVVSAQPERVSKEGYLTKRGKNFGGWKARYFVLDDPMLRYYESPNGTLLGTIKLYRAQIGKQSPPKTPGVSDESDGQYRHAFLIREPKKKDSNSYIDHVLCAESDLERDAWVDALMRYINYSEGDSKTRPRVDKTESGSVRMGPPSRKTSSKQNLQLKESPESEEFDHLQAVSYEDTFAAQPPQVRIIPDPRPEETPSPLTPNYPPQSVERAASTSSKPISGPQNGVKINDAGAWGNKPMASPLPGHKEPKKRSIFGFHNKDNNLPGSNHPNGSDLNLTQSQQQYQEQITNVKAAFGAPLSEAAEHCGPHGVDDVCLPAVVYRCLKYLEAKNAANEEGIFRMNGSNNLIKNLRAKFNYEGDFDILASGQWYDINAVASLLKQYLRELPAPILTREMHLKFLQVLGKLAMSHQYMSTLPFAN